MPWPMFPVPTMPKEIAEKPVKIDRTGLRELADDRVLTNVADMRGESYEGYYQAMLGKYQFMERLNANGVDINKPSELLKQQFDHMDTAIEKAERLTISSDAAYQMALLTAANAVMQKDDRAARRDLIILYDAEKTKSLLAKHPNIKIPPCFAGNDSCDDLVKRIESARKLLIANAKDLGAPKELVERAGDSLKTATDYARQQNMEAVVTAVNDVQDVLKDHLKRFQSEYYSAPPHYLHPKNRAVTQVQVALEELKLEARPMTAPGASDINADMWLMEFLEMAQINQHPYVRITREDVSNHIPERPQAKLPKVEPAQRDLVGPPPR